MAYPKIANFLPLLTLCANDLIGADEKEIEDYRRKFRYLSKISQRACAVDMGIVIVSYTVKAFRGEAYSQQLQFEKKKLLIQLIIQNQIR